LELVVVRAILSEQSNLIAASPLSVLLISTFDLGRQPFGLASPAAWLRARGTNVTCLDLSREELAEEAVRATKLIALYVPMHTATRLAIALLPAIRKINPRAHLCFYGLYAPVNEAYLRGLGVETILGGEFEEGLCSLAARLAGNEATSAQVEPVVSLARQRFEVPDRRGLMPIEKYARLILPGGEARTVGSTEASRGCKHLCRHCPIVPVYNGVFRIVDREVVLADIRQQVAAGAQHISFGDPDFFNGIGHALPLMEAFQHEFPQLTYDVTIKIEHLLKHREMLPKLRDTGCVFVTSAVESVDDAVLEKLDKHHTRADFLEVIKDFRQAGLTLQPTFVPFSPWTTLDGFCILLRDLRQHVLIESVAPIQLAIRLLIPAGSRLLELEDIRNLVQPFDEAALFYPWNNPDPRVDELCKVVQDIVSAGEKAGRARTWIFERIEDAAFAAAGEGKPDRPAKNPLAIVSAAATVPYMDEPWYCCAEPTGDQFLAIAHSGKAEGRA
jgi:Radical SAM superfamily